MESSSLTRPAWLPGLRLVDDQTTAINVVFVWTYPKSVASTKRLAA